MFTSSLIFIKTSIKTLKTAVFKNPAGVQNKFHYFTKTAFHKFSRISQNKLHCFTISPNSSKRPFIHRVAVVLAGIAAAGKPVLFIQFVRFKFQSEPVNLAFIIACRKPVFPETPLFHVINELVPPDRTQAVILSPQLNCFQNSGSGYLAFVSCPAAFGNKPANHIRFFPILWSPRLSLRPRQALPSATAQTLALPTQECPHILSRAFCPAPGRAHPAL